MRKIQLKKVMLEEAEKLGEGPVIFAYKDGNTIRMETENGEDPWVWRKGSWRKMSGPYIG